MSAETGMQSFFVAEGSAAVAVGGRAIVAPAVQRPSDGCWDSD